MQKDIPVKCISKEYDSNNFYLIQHNGENKRFVVSFPSPIKNKEFVEVYIHSIKNIFVEVKIVDLNDSQNPNELYARVNKDLLLQVLNKYSEFFFYDGFHELMVKTPDSSEYIALDEHGLIFIYTDFNFSNFLEKQGLKYMPNQKLVYEFNHFHYRTPNAETNLKEIITLLSLR